MRLSAATITANTAIGDENNDIHLIELHAPRLAQAVQAGQYCMIRCCHSEASDPLLRRPFFIHSTRQGLCTLLVRVRGRGTAWLAQQPVGAQLDMLGPLGHGWSISRNARNLLLVSDVQLIAPLPLLMQAALEQELAVTLLCQSRTPGAAYPPALLPPEVEYHIIANGESVPEDLFPILGEYLSWADAAFCCIPRETATVLYNHFERLRGKHFAQGIVLQPLVCGSGACFTCSIPTHSGPKLVCRDGPVFPLREIVR